MMASPTKTCSKCRRGWPKSDYYPHSRTFDKLSPSCKHCAKERYVPSRAKELYQAKRAYRIQYAKDWIKQNPERQTAYKSTPQQKAHHKESKRIRNLLFNSKKLSSRYNPILGCSAQELAAHIEKQWKPGMTWENHGFNGWHIDHIIPAKAFDLTDPEQVKRFAHYTNVQPLWAKENMQKHGNFDQNEVDKMLGGK
jgi:hypothetical protein